MSTVSGRVGIIGAGAMGMVFVERLLAKGFIVSVFDPSPNARERATTAGAVCLEDAAAVFARGGPVITCLFSSKAFASTVDAALAVAKSGTRVGPVIETSTLHPQVKEEARVRLADVETVLLDCPVSGTSAQAQKGDLLVLASGDRAALATCEPIFTAIARTTIRAGEFGRGMQLKLLANHLVGLHTAAAAEVLALARKAGLDPEVAIEALSQGAGYSRMLEVRGPLMANHTYLPATGSLDVIIKDGALIKDLGKQVGCGLPLFDRAYTLYEAAQAAGMGEGDMAGLHSYLLEHYASPST